MYCIYLIGLHFPLCTVLCVMYLPDRVAFSSVECTGTVFSVSTPGTSHQHQLPSHDVRRPEIFLKLKNTKK